MLEAATIERYVRPLGYKLEVHPVEQVQDLDLLEDTDRATFQVKALGKRQGGLHGGCIFQMSLPLPDQHGAYTIDDLRCMLVREAIVDYVNSPLLGPPKHIFRDRRRVACMLLTQALSRALGPFHITGEPPTDQQVQISIEAAFKPSGRSPVRLVPDNPIGQEDLKSVVYVWPPDHGLDTTQRLYQEAWWNALDPASTPGSEKANVAFRLAHGARVESGQVHRGSSPFCTTIQHYHLPVCYTPRRTHIARSAYCGTLPLVDPETPLVGNPGLPGKHLFTAIMNLPSYTGDDAIVVSQSAARKMTAIRTLRERVFLSGEFHVKIKVGDVIGPGDPLVEAEEGTRYPRRIQRSATVTSVSLCPSSYMGTRCLRLTATLSYEASLADGDKVITRNAVKGVVRVLPDDRMPHLQDGTPLEMVLSPESVVNRRAMGVFWEMMATEHRLNGGEVLVDHFDPRPTFPQLVAEGYGAKQQLFLDHEKLPYMTYCGHLFLLRLDKIAAELVSVCRGEDCFTGMRTRINNARMSGQKRDLAKAQAMFGRGLVKNFIALTKNNASGAYALQETLKVLGAVQEG